MPTSTLFLFGSSTPWLPPPWITTDDRVRGGASQSYLSTLPDNCALFHGHLDTSTLGGAGFASQFSDPKVAGNTTSTVHDDEDGSWDLSSFDGIELEVGNGDEKIYTLMLKDELPAEKREDGREKAGLNWETDFRVGKGQNDEGEKKEGVTKVWVPWGDFRATYRGKEKEDAGSLKTGEVRRIGFMMRSHFGRQDGDFSLELKSVCGKKVHRTESMSELNQKPAVVEASGWLGWISGLCTVS